MRLHYVAVEGFQIELEFAKVFGLELDNLELKRDQAGERPVEEEQVEFEVSSAHRLKKSRSSSKSRPPTWTG